MADYKLADLLGIAGATIGIIIAAGVLLGCFVARYTAVFERYRALAGEYRSNQVSDPRRGTLRTELVTYRRQITYLNSASLCVGLAVLLFLVTVTVASLSVMFPDIMALRLAGTVGLFTGLLAIGAGVCFLLADGIAERRRIGKEVSDFSDLPSLEEALKE